MHTRLLSLLTIALAVGFAVPTMAAPQSVSKKRLIVPDIDARILPVTARALSRKLVEEFECGNTIYRYWEMGSVRTDPTSSGGLVVFEARQGAMVKWRVNREGWNASPAYSASYGFHGCNDGSVYILKRASSGRQGWSEYRIVQVSFNSFQHNSVWDFANGVGYTYAAGAAAPLYTTIDPVFVDGIFQVPGRLVVSDAGILGDSRPQTMEKNSVSRHTLPWYRDLNQAKDAGASLEVLFYRLHDGYAVKENTFDCQDWRCSVTSTVFYRIHDGEARYSVVESLPIENVGFIHSITQDANGGVLVNGETNEKILLHGLPKAPEEQASPYVVSGSVLGESESSVYVRYLITDTRNNSKQYWEVTVRK